MHGSRIRLPDGSVAFVDGAAPRYPKCSTQGCRRAGKLQCDGAIFEHEDARKPPAIGDARVHKLQNAVFYVRRLHDNETVTITTSPPGSSELRFPHTVSLADWFAKTSATCGKHVCNQCAGHVGSLDFCFEHSPRAR